MDRQTRMQDSEQLRGLFVVREKRSAHLHHTKLVETRIPMSHLLSPAKGLRLGEDLSSLSSMTPPRTAGRSSSNQAILRLIRLDGEQLDAKDTAKVHSTASNVSKETMGRQGNT